MKQVAKVKLISVQSLDIVKYLRKEMNLTLSEAKELSKNDTVIDFNGNIEKAIAFYNYVYSLQRNSARLIIDFTYDTRGFVSGEIF